MSTKKALCSLWILPFVITACSGLLTSGEPPKQYYLLTPYDLKSGPEAAPEGPTLTLSVAAVPGLDTDRILAVDPDARLSHYANARWPDNLPETLSSVMQRSLASSGRFSAVTASEGLSPNSWKADLEVQQFYGSQDGAGTTREVVARMAGNVTCGGQRQALDLAASHPVAEERLSAVVAAHQAVLNELTRQLLEHIDNDCVSD